MTPPRIAAQDGDVVPSDRSVLLERADRARIRGDTAAPIRVVEVSDFECPFCAGFHRESFNAIDSLYVRPGLVQYLWISYANPTHPLAWPAIEASFCAGGVGRFWGMHALLFERQETWSEAEDVFSVFRSYAVELGIDPESFSECMRQDWPAPLQLNDYQSAVSSGINSTPFFIVGDSVAVRGAVSLAEFRATLDSMLVLRGATPP